MFLLLQQKLLALEGFTDPAFLAYIFLLDTLGRHLIL
ncbi:hypothetical protein C5167_021578 [Papaver somniferum]|nr:hypothetical protein C5167_021578 [Papaver somniferum]